MLEVVKQFFACSNWITWVFSDNRGLFRMALNFSSASTILLYNINMVAGVKKCSFVEQHMDFVGSSFSDLIIGLAVSSILDVCFFPVGLVHLIDFPSFIIVFLTQKTVARWTTRLSTMLLSRDPAQSILDMCII